MNGRRIAIRSREPWTEEDRAFVAANYREMGAKACAEALGRTPHACTQMAASIGAYYYTRQKARPPKRLYEAALNVAADSLGVHIRDALGCSRQRHIVRARWLAWKTLYETGKYSTTGIGYTAGYDHSTIVHGLARLRRERLAEMRGAGG